MRARTRRGRRLIVTILMVAFLFVAGSLAAELVPRSSLPFRVAAIGVLVVAVLAGIVNARRIPYRRVRPRPPLSVTVPLLAGIGLLWKVAIDGAPAPWRMLANVAACGVFVFFLITLVPIWRYDLT